MAPPSTRALAVIAAGLWSAWGAGGVRAEDLFALTEVPVDGRTVAAELADLDGDGRSDLLVVRIAGLPPAEERTLRVHLQDAEGRIPAVPSHVVPVPEWSAVYDLADVRPEVPGVELVALRHDGVSILSLAGPDAPRTDLPVPGATTLGAAPDERGLEPYPLVSRAFGPEPWILVPQIGELTALSPTGAVHAHLATPRRGNYFIMQGTGLVTVESDLQIFLDAPKLAVGDVDGDGRPDIATATRHEIRVFLRRPDGSFAHEADRRLPIGLVTAEDHMRGSGGVSAEMKDADGDGRLDLLLTHVKGSFADAETRIHFHRGRGGAWDLAAPDQSFESEASVGSNGLFDLDGDGRLELLRVELEVGVFEIVELLLSRAIDARIAVHRLAVPAAEDAGGHATPAFEEDPWFREKLSVPLDFDTFRPEGFVPRMLVDMNGDGWLDFVASGEGEALEVHLGGRDGPFAGRPRRQEMSTRGVIRFGELDGDDLPDFVLFDPDHLDVPVRVGRNLGRLPGTRPRIGPRAAED